MAQVVERMQRANRTKTIGDGTSPKPQVQNTRSFFFFPSVRAMIQG